MPVVSSLPPDGAWYPRHQINPAVVAELKNRFTGVGIESDQVSLTRPEEDSVVVTTISPVGDASRVVKVGW